LLIVDSDRRRYPNLGYASLVDIAPTVARRLGVPIPEVWEGVSLLDGPQRTHSFHQTRRPYTCRAALQRRSDGLFKYQRCGRAENPLDMEVLFELTSDPGEKNNLIGGGYDEVLLGLKTDLAEYFGLHEAAPRPLVFAHRRSLNPGEELRTR
jgi:hypothetical protein